MYEFCINTTENVVATVGSIVAGAATLANFVPAPDKITNPTLRAFSRLLHFVAVDVVTAVSKTPTEGEPK